MQSSKSVACLGWLEGLLLAAFCPEVIVLLKNLRLLVCPEVAIRSKGLPLFRPVVCPKITWWLEGLLPVFRPEMPAKVKGSRLLAICPEIAGRLGLLPRVAARVVVELDGFLLS